MIESNLDSFLGLIEEIIKFAELESFSKTKLKYYSNGMRVRLAFSTVLQINPDILLLDEILAVGDALFKRKCLNSISLFKKKSKNCSFYYTQY